MTFAAVVESMVPNEVELGEYCRKKGIYPEQTKSWCEACEQANDWGTVLIRIYNCFNGSFYFI